MVARAGRERKWSVHLFATAGDEALCLSGWHIFATDMPPNIDAARPVATMHAPSGANDDETPAGPKQAHET